MKITSPVFENTGKIPKKYTCDGENVNPPLSFIGIPSQTKSLALIVDDPDAPGGTWTHWVVFNINPQILEVKENSLPAGSIQGLTSFGKLDYGGPCPPSGTHRYFFKLYALDAVLSLKDRAGKEKIEEEIGKHLIESAELTGIYRRMP
ncbi:MAG: YbhB/YbcL family Raf kinase inhibitor-like protein [Patescibacteria group bacterium]|nr:YbhB/YbcL family Raf kinase inhibitor-like protein [Patescibacteria group bacterium]